MQLRLEAIISLFPNRPPASKSKPWASMSWGCFMEKMRRVRSLSMLTPAASLRGGASGLGSQAHLSGSRKWGVQRPLSWSGRHCAPQLEGGSWFSGTRRPTSLGVGWAGKGLRAGEVPGREFRKSPCCSFRPSSLGVCHHLVLRPELSESLWPSQSQTAA